MRKFTKVLVPIYLVCMLLLTLPATTVSAAETPDTASATQLETSMAYTYTKVTDGLGTHLERRFFNTVQGAIDFAKLQSLKIGTGNDYQKGYGIYLLKDFILDKDYVLPAKDVANTVAFRVGDFFGAKLGLPSIQPTELTIDLNGHYIDGNKENFSYSNQGYNGYAAVVLSGDNHGVNYDITIQDSQGGGYIYGSASGIHVFEGATLNFNSGTVYARAQGKTGTVTAPEAYGIYSESVVNINGGIIDMMTLPDIGQETRDVGIYGVINLGDGVFNFNSGKILTNQYAIYEDTGNTYLSKDAYYDGYVYSDTPITTFHTPISHLPIIHNQTEQMMDLSIFKYGYDLFGDKVLYEISDVQEIVNGVNQTVNSAGIPPISNVRMEGAVLKFDYDTTSDLNKKFEFNIKLYPESAQGLNAKDNYAVMLTVQAEIVSPHAIIAIAEQNGNITPSGTVKVPHQTDQTFVITPNEGYQIKDVLVDGISIGAKSSYTFTEVITNHEIRVSFVKKETSNTPEKPDISDTPDSPEKPKDPDISTDGKDKQDKPQTNDISNIVPVLLLLIGSVFIIMSTQSVTNKKKSH